MGEMFWFNWFGKSVTELKAILETNKELIAINEQIRKVKHAINLFNVNTIDLVLNKLMSEGLRVEGNEKLGKTIIFAKNSRHAKAIVDRFNTIYSEYGGNFAKVIISSAETTLPSIIPPLIFECYR